jgi:uroporphyrinogen-III synthase
VLVTRPEPGAARTAARLDRAGFEPVVVPLSETVALAPRLPDGSFEAVAVSSANAVRHASAELIARLATWPVFAVGEETAAIARDTGFRDVRSSAGSGTELARDIAAATGRHARIAYLCGRVRLGTLEAELAGYGIGVVPIETYDTHARAAAAAELAAVESGPIFAALVYSATAAEALAGLAGPRSGTVFSHTAFIAISKRVAEKLLDIAPGKVFAAMTPDEDAMFDVLLRLGHEAAAFPDNLA